MTDANPRPDSSDPEAERPRRERKERVLHTRISQQLAEDIGRVAEDLRVPVSNLVRNVLEEVFSVVETVADNVGELIEGVMDEAERARQRRAGEPPRPESKPTRPDPPEVLGWQPLILARESICAGCDAKLPRGESAYLGVTAAGAGSAHTLCASCLDARRSH
jgi:hypothetical protein